VFLTQWGSFGSGDGQFSTPYGIATDALGYVYVADAANNRVQKFTNTGGFVLTWGAPGNGNGQFNGSGWVATDGYGTIYVTDTFNHRVQAFGPGAVPTLHTTWGTVKSRYRGEHTATEPPASR